MKINIEIAEGLTQLQQMAASMGVDPVDNQIEIPSSMGTGFCRLYCLPFQIQLHHYQYCLDQQVEVQSVNPVDTGMYIININLSQKLLDKQIGTAQHWMSRSGNHGVLYYSPGNDSAGKNEIGLPFEVVFFSVPKAALRQFLNSLHLDDAKLEQTFCHYTEITDELRDELRQSLHPDAKLNLFYQQGKFLEILGKILALFYREDWQVERGGLKMEDVEILLKVKHLLHSHIFGTAPTINELALQSNMSPSQLKSKFKSLFGSSIYQYYLTSKLKVAQTLLQKGEGTVAEIGYRLGYSNISQFSAQFKKRFGISPSHVKG
ncbi:MAG: AraC family transcriptional regulator [Bacteroidota bacterium]